MQFIFSILLLFFLTTGIHAQNNYFKFSQLPDLPPNSSYSTQPGLAGPYTGIDDGVLIVAGGANFPDKLPWKGGPKTYYTEIFILKTNTTGEYSARYYKFRLKLKSNNNSANPKVSGMSVDVDVPDRQVEGADLTTSGGTRAITFDPPYFQQYAIGVSSQNLQNGDRHTITNKTLSGFTINYFNSSGSAVDRSFDFISKGF